MEFQINKVEKGDIDTEELKKQIPGWCSLLKKSPDDERLRIIVASMFYFIDEKEKSSGSNPDSRCFKKYSR